jgi:integrase
VSSGEQILRLHQQQPRRAPGPRGGGSIVQYQGRWRVRIRWQGKEQTWMVDTPEAARALLSEKLALRDQLASDRLTLNGWLDEWLAQMAMARPRTHPFYRQKVAHLRPKLGRTVLTQLDSRAIRLALAELQDEGMSPTMLHHVFKSLSSALNAAVAEGRLTANPCHAIAAPRKAQFEAPTLTVEQAQRLIAVARETKYGPLLTVALSTGMRAGELLALTWEDVDLLSGQITVNKSVQWKARGRHVVGPTKTRSGRRAVKVEGAALGALVEQRRRTLEADYDLVFPSIRGTFWVPQGRFVRDFRGLLATSGCPRIRFHDLRHTAGLFLTRSVGVVVASRILGHADPSITARYYGHAQQEDYSAAARAMSGMLGGSGDVSFEDRTQQEG